MEDLVHVVAHLKRKIERYIEDEASDSKISKILSRLDALDITVECLKETGIGKIVNAFRKRDDFVGSQARELVTKWKSISIPVGPETTEVQKPNPEPVDETRSRPQSKKRPNDVIRPDSPVNIKRENGHVPFVPIDRPPDRPRKVSPARIKQEPGVHASSTKRPNDALHNNSPVKVKKEVNVFAGPSQAKAESRPIQNKTAAKRKEPSEETTPPPLLSCLARLPNLEEDPDISDLLNISSTPSTSGAVAVSLPAVDDYYTITSKRARTSVFSGRARPRAFTQVPKLEDLCMRVLMDHIPEIEEMGPVPYLVIKPVLEACTPKQLANLEDFNPHLLDDTNELWAKHCEKDFRIMDPDDEDIGFRETYMRKQSEREAKLLKLTRTIKDNTKAREAPVRQVKLAFVDPKALTKGFRIGRSVNGAPAQPTLRQKMAAIALPPAPKTRGWGGASSGASSAKVAVGPKSGSMMQKMRKAFKSTMR